MAYLLGDLTSSTRLSKACVTGVVVEGDDVYVRLATANHSKGIDATYHDCSLGLSDQLTEEGKASTGRGAELVQN